MEDGFVARWRERVERWSRSGLSMAEFARREGVTTGQFGYWKKRLGARAPLPTSSKSRALAMVPVVVSQDAASAGSSRPGTAASADFAEPPSLEVVVAEGLVVRVGRGFDERMLAGVVRAVRSVSLETTS